MRFRLLLWCCCGLLVGGLVGCGSRPATVPVTGAGISGRVHGGQQAVVGATIQLYTVGTKGDGSNATPLLTKTVTTDSTGSFTITGLYSCSDATEVYITATGGDPSPGEANANLAMMTALGPCSALTPGTYIFVNELTTVAAVNALAPFMKSYGAVGSGSGDVGALQAAFGLAGEFVDTATGVAPGLNVPAGYAVPTATINMLGDITAACINSGGGVAGDGSACGTLFTLTTLPQGVAPTNTVAALLNLADDPTLNTTQLYNLPEPQAPFQPQLTAVPSSFAIGLEVPGSGTLQVTPTSIAFPFTLVGSTSAPQTLTFLNTGSTVVGNLGFLLMGTDPGSFAETTTCGSTVQPGESCTMQVTATPKQPGVQDAFIQGGPSDISLSVAGVEPGVPGSLSVSGVESWTIAGMLQDVVVSNPGPTPVTISNIQTGTQYFSVMGSNCGSVLAAASSCTVPVESNAYGNTTGPSDVEPTYTDTLTITSSAGIQTVPLSATDYHQLSATEDAPPSLSTPLPSFGVQPLPSGDHYFPPSQALWINVVSYYSYQQLEFGVGGADPEDFFTGLTQNGFTVPFTGCPDPNPCSFNVYFGPSTTGLRTAKITYGSMYINVSGIGQGMGSSFDVGTGTFAPTFLAPNNTATTTGTLVVTNTGTATVNPTSVSITGPAAANFSATQSGCSGLAPVATCTVNIAFNTTALGTYAATLAVTDASLGVTNTTPLNVNVGYSFLTSPYSGGFSLAAPAGTTSSGFAVTIADQNGNALGHPLSATFSAQSLFSFSGGSTCPASTSQVCTLTAIFTVPAGNTVGQTSQDMLVVTDLTSGNTISIPVTGIVSQ